jgi:hypothetical protein
MKESKIKHIMGKYYWITRFTLNKMIEIHSKAKLTHKNMEYKERSMVYAFYDVQGKTDEEIGELWRKTHSEKQDRSQPYKQKPVRERRDNQNPETYGINYSNSPSYGNHPKIRIPSKKHKNRYKNFLKLFPQFKEK